MPAPKFNFLPLRQAAPKEKVEFCVTITSTGQMRFRREDILVYELEGKFVQFLVDKEKKSLAWKYYKGSPSQEAMQDLDLRQLKTNSSGTMMISVQRALSLLGAKEDVSYVNLPVRKYEAGYLSDEVSYVVLDDEMISTKVAKGGRPRKDGSRPQDDIRGDSGYHSGYMKKEDGE
jgi:hypothetical protein